MINSRQKKIMSYIIEERSYPLNEIAEMLGISTRTIYRDVKKINDWLEKNGVDTKGSIETVNFLKDKESEKRIRKLLDSLEVEEKYDAEDRQMILITELLLSSEPLKIFYLASKLNVAEGTVISDLDKAEEWLGNYGIRLVRKQGLGVYVEGAEKNIRSSIMNIFYKGLAASNIRDVLKKLDEGEARRAQTDIANRLLGLVDEKVIHQVEKVIISMEKSLGEKLTDDAYIGLMAHIILAISRLRNGDVIKVRKEVLASVKDTAEYVIATQAKRMLEEDFDIQIPEDEVAYITMHLRGAKIKGAPTDLERSTYYKYDVPEIVKDMLEVAHKDTGMDFLSDRDLITGLVIHLRPAITRLELNMSIRNPLLDSIKNQYRDIFELSKTMCSVLEERLGIRIPDEEIGFVAMHLGAFYERKKTGAGKRIKTLVVCPSGLGTSKLLVSKLSKEIDELDVVASASVVEVEEYMDLYGDLGLIISTVNLGEKDFDYLVVNPLLPDEDISFIKRTIGIVGLEKGKEKTPERGKRPSVHKATKTFDMKKLKQYIEASEIIKSHLFVKDGLSITNSDEMLKYIGRFLFYNEPLKAQDLYEELKKREELMGTALTGKKIAIVHTRSEVVDHATFGVFRNKKDIPFNDVVGNVENIDTIALMLMKKTEPKEYREVLGVISKLMVEYDDFILLLRENPKEDILEVLKIGFDEFVQEYVKSCE